MTDTIDVAALVERLKPRWIADEPIARAAVRNLRACNGRRERHKPVDWHATGKFSWNAN